MIWSVCKWCRKRITRTDKGLCRQSDVCSNIDDLGTVAFACCNEDISESAGTMIVSANATSKIIDKDVLLMLS